MKLTLLGLLAFSITQVADGEPSSQTRPAGNNAELERWLTNMAVHHRYSITEMRDVTGLTEPDLSAALETLKIDPDQPAPVSEDQVRVLPYPGGRHPRIGFLDGAVDPQRETKISVFSPWRNETTEGFDYVVVDCPEAIWSNLGLTYLAHTHVPTVWTEQGVELPRQEWKQHQSGRLTSHRKLPNGIEFTADVTPGTDHVLMSLDLENGTDETLTGLRVQQCVMLKGASAFAEQSNDNKRSIGEYALAHDPTQRRWIITAWKPNHRTWFNPPCPCLHSDPKFPDCKPGEKVTVRGWLSFYEGDNVDGEVARIEQLNWWKTGKPSESSD